MICVITDKVLSIYSCPRPVVQLTKRTVFEDGM